MAAVSTAIAAATLAYGIYSNENAANERRAAEAKQDRENQAIAVEQTNTKARLDAARDRDIQKLRQRGGTSSAGSMGTATSDVSTGSSSQVSSPIGAYSGRTLLGA